MEFNHEQMQAITCTRGPVAVISCAGSGKTSVILERAKRIVEAGCPPHKILVVTFSKAAAAELEARYQKTYGYVNAYDNIYRNQGIRFSTIHSLCYSVLAKTCRLQPESILKEQEKRSFFQEWHQRGLAEREKAASRDFDEFYRDLLTYIGKKITEPVEGRPFFEKVYAAYGAFKRQLKKIDFDDMILLCHRYFTEREDVLAYWQGLFDYIMIDEFQDTSLMQAEIFYLLAKPHRNLCVVGDDDQSIYGFRGADSRIFQSFFQAFPDCRQIVMDTNYRSFPGITEAASRLISHNKHRIIKRLRPWHRGEAQIALRRCDSEEEQISWVLDSIRQSLKEGRAAHEIAVLYRVKSEAAALVDRLILEQLPFFIQEMPEDIHRGMVCGDILAYYRLSHGFPENGDLVRIINRPKRYIKTNLVRGCSLNRNEIYQACCRDAVSTADYDRINDTINDLFLDLRNLSKFSPRDFLSYLEHEMGYLESLMEYAEYRNLDGERLERDFLALKSEAALFDSMSAWSSFASEPGKRMHCDPNGVYLSTFHGAKGLEWKDVFIISAHEAVTPCIAPGRTADLEEERRLFYVAVTRAMERLGISSIVKGRGGKRESRFLKEMERINIE